MYGKRPRGSSAAPSGSPWSASAGASAPNGCDIAVGIRSTSCKARPASRVSARCTAGSKSPAAGANVFVMPFATPPILACDVSDGALERTCRSYRRPRDLAPTLAIARQLDPCLLHRRGSDRPAVLADCQNARDDFRRTTLLGSRQEYPVVVHAVSPLEHGARATVAVGHAARPPRQLDWHGLYGNPSGKPSRSSHWFRSCSRCGDQNRGSRSRSETGHHSRCHGTALPQGPVLMSLGAQPLDNFLTDYCGALELY
jgi:hypothetical protein